MQILIPLIPLVFLLCSCGEENKKPTDPNESSSDKALNPLSPEETLNGLITALREQRINSYTSLLDDDFWFDEMDCNGGVFYQNGRQDEIDIITKLFSTFVQVEADFQLIRRSIEPKSTSRDSVQSEYDYHPDSEWSVFRGRVTSLLLDDAGDGFRIDQVMTLKMKQTENNTWKIIRWANDVQSNICENGKLSLLAVPGGSWSQVKLTLLESKKL